MPKPEQNQQQAGKYMLLIGWLIGLGLLALLFSKALDKQYNPNSSVNSTITSGQHREVQLKRNRDGHYLARGHINDQPVTFLLDTGATGVIIPAHIAKQLNLARGHPGRAITANGTITIYKTRLPQIGLGAIKMYDIAAHINPHMQADEILLGMSFLKKLELVQRDNILTLRQTHR